MSIEILTAHQGAATPVLWRIVERRAGNTSDQAEIEIAIRFEQARRDGFANGVAAARQEAEHVLIPAIQKLADFLVQIARMRDAIREQATEDLVGLALQIASRVMHRDVVLDSIVLAGLLRAAFTKLRSKETSMARIHPAVEPLLRACLERGGTPTNLSVLADSKLKPGKVAFETDANRDSSADVDLTEIDRGLTDRLAE